MKTDDYKKIEGQFMGIIKFTPSGWQNFKDAKKKYFKNKKKVFTTDILNSLAKEKNFSIKVIKYNDRWSEIDNAKDIKISKELFK